MKQLQKVVTKLESLPANASLSDLADALGRDYRMWRQRRLVLLRDLKAFARLYGEPLGSIPANPEAWGDWAVELRKSGDPATLKVLNNVRAVVERFGLSSLAGRHRHRLNSCWSKLLASVSHPRHRVDLGPLAQYASGRGLTPEALDAATIETFLSAVEAEGLRPRPHSLVRSAVRSWNWAKDAVPGWPQIFLAPPSRSDTFSFPWNIFPLSLAADVHAFEHELTTGLSERLRGRGPIREESLAQVDWLLRAYVSAVVRAGRSTESITSLADIVETSAFRAGLSYLIERSGAKVSRRTSNVAMVVMSIARDWVQLPPDRLQEMDALAQRVRLRPDGLSAAARDVLRQFDDPGNVRALLTLPGKLKRKASRAGSSKEADRLAQMAMALEIFCLAPIRPTEILSLRPDSFDQLPCGGLRMKIERNGYRRTVTATYSLPKSTAKMLAWYLRRDRRSLPNGSSTSLFTGDRSRREPKPDLFRRAIMATIAIETGLYFPPSSFRHFAAKHYLADNPGDFEVVRAIVGHRSVIKTAKVYGFLNAAAAAAAVDGFLRNPTNIAGGSDVETGARSRAASAKSRGPAVARPRGCH